MNKSIKILLGVIVAVVTASYIMPVVFMSNGVDSYSGEEKILAQQAIDEVVLALSSPSTYKIYTTKMVVRNLEPTSDALCPYTATVTLHTLLGYKYGSFTVRPNCGVSPTT
jgi:hypothetical protein